MHNVRRSIERKGEGVRPSFRPKEEEKDHVSASRALGWGGESKEGSTRSLCQGKEGGKR